MPASKKRPRNDEQSAAREAFQVKAKLEVNSDVGLSNNLCDADLIVLPDATQKLSVTENSS